MSKILFINSSSNPAGNTARLAATLLAGKEYNMKNPFGLVYADAIAENVPGKVTIHPVSYEVNGIKVAANLYLPADFDESKQVPAVTSAYPNGGSKEQVSGIFAQKLAEAGYVTIVADARYQGGSEGTPRNRDYPSNRIDDVSGMVDYLSTLPY